MSSFAIQRGAGVICTWDVDTGHATCHERATQQNGMLVIEESSKLAFVHYGPVEDHEYRVTIGDVPLSEIAPAMDDAGCFRLDDRIVWREWNYFESARGLTRLLLERKEQDADANRWTPVLAAEVYVLPSKLGEVRYDCMVQDLMNISRSLIIDLYGKSRHTHDLLLAKEGGAFRSGDQELQSIESVLDRFGPLLQSISLRPASMVSSRRVQKKYWGGAPLTPAAVAWLSRRGHTTVASELPITVLTSQKSESFNITEHRVIRAFLDILGKRAEYCHKVARGHIRAIQSERHLRHIRIDNRQTLYEMLDLPKIKRLELAVVRAERCLVLIDAMKDLPFLRGILPELVAAQEGAFQRNGEYQLVAHIIRQFLLSNAVWYEGDEQSDVTKLTSRLFEQWCYLRTIEGFRACGLVLKEWNDALRQNLKSRFILDFDRGLAFEGELGTEIRLRIRYEPWILSLESATKMGETLCRGATGDVAWCPDIVIECLRLHGGDWLPVYVVVLDCKYTGRINDKHWSDTQKYLEIRNTNSRRQVVKQLWLIVPESTGEILSEDSAINFGTDGPTCRPDEAVRFVLAASPGADGGDTFRDFAKGITTYFRRHFGSESEVQHSA